nr:hypothetical protein [Tanacetum cinerariifolium]
TRHPLEIPSPPLLLPSTSYKDDTPKADMPLQKRARFTTPASGFKVRESLAAAAARQPVLDVATVDATPRHLMSREVGYEIEDVWDDMVRDIEERAPTTIEGLSQRVTDLSTTLAWDTHEIHTLEAKEPAHTNDPEDPGSSYDALPTVLSPGYVANSDSKEDPEEDAAKDPADYPTDGGDDDDDESSDDDDDEEEQKASEEVDKEEE